MWDCLGCRKGMNPEGDRKDWCDSEQGWDDTAVQSGVSGLVSKAECIGRVERTL